jgi:hypothetical protein
MLSEMCIERWLTKSWVLLLVGLLTSGVFSCFAQEERPGFKDTPMLPGEKWHVHDPDRPYPPVVTPALRVFTRLRDVHPPTLLFFLMARTWRLGCPERMESWLAPAGR